MQKFLAWIGAGIFVFSMAVLVVSLLSGCTPIGEIPQSRDPNAVFNVDEGIKVPMDGLPGAEEPEQQEPGLFEEEDEGPIIELAPGELGEAVLIPVDGDGRPLDGSELPEVAPVRRPEDLEGYGAVVTKGSDEPRIGVGPGIE